MFNVQIREANTNTSNAGTPISNELSVDSVLSTERHAFWTDGQSLYENRKAYLYKYYKASTFFLEVNSNITKTLLNSVTLERFALQFFIYPDLQ